MNIEHLFPAIPGLEIQNISKIDSTIEVHLNLSLNEGECPCCHQKSFRVHSKYSRRFTDLPWAGNSVNIQIKTRKFFCDTYSCKRKIFTERIVKEVLPYARRTIRLDEQLEKIGFATGGNPGVRLAKEIGINTSASTILRLLRNSPDSVLETPKVLGVDDWAFRKGQTYGTILVDLEKRKAIDLLPDRESKTLEEWLKNHPGVEIISRDRAGPYSTGAKAGAPNAIQVADRWHLLKNLSEALKRMLNGYNSELRLTAKELMESRRSEEMKTLLKAEEKRTKSLEITTKGNPREEPIMLSKFHLNFLEVKKLKKEGYSIRSINRQTGVHRTTIQRYLKHDMYPEPSPPSTRPIEVRDYEDYIQKRWKEGEQNGMQLFREIRVLGFQGSFQSVHRLINKYPKAPVDSLPKPLKIRAWSARRVSLLLNIEFDRLKQEEQEYLTILFKHCPKVEEASVLARKFKEMSNKLKVSLLDPWIEQAKSSGLITLKNFAVGLENDYEAVKSAFSLEWSNGQVEGHVNRLKTIKRQMYGRANFHLLRKRVIANTS